MPTVLLAKSCKFIFLLGLIIMPWQIAHAEVFGELSHDLDDVSFSYEYASGRQYDISFTDGTMAYLRKDVPGRETIGGIPYIARKIDDNIYLVNWHRPERTEFITLLIRFDEHKLFTSALLEGSDQHFDLATIVSSNWKKMP